ncbi:MAG: ATP-binding protein [Candidatus Latescibacterota bacterium]
MYGRQHYLDSINTFLTRFPVVGIIGARQIGKTTLARAYAKRCDDPVALFDLENPLDLAKLTDPMLALQDLKGLVVIDEVQRQPGLFPILRVLVDRPDSPARFLVLGSASPQLLRQGSETLAGRIIYLELSGFSLQEVPPEKRDRLWLRGGFPKSFLAPDDNASMEWRQAFASTFLERDLPQLGIDVAASTMRRFWTMLAHTHGQVWNASKIARSFGVSDRTVRRYLDHLDGTLVVRQLQPWHENLRKRQVKSPKVYFCDTGLLHALLNLPLFDDLSSHPSLGASWEGFLLFEVVRLLHARENESFFWATHAGAELDLLFIRGRHRLGFEFKRTVSPRVTHSMKIAVEDLKLERLDVVHAGDGVFPLAENIRAVGVNDLCSVIGK